MKATCNYVVSARAASIATTIAIIESLKKIFVITDKLNTIHSLKEDYENKINSSH